MRFVIRVLIAALLVLGLGFYCWQYMEGIWSAELEGETAERTWFVEMGERGGERGGGDDAGRGEERRGEDGI